MNVTVYVADMNSYSKRQKRTGQDRNAFIWISMLVCLVGLASISAHAIPPPRLLIQPLAGSKVAVTWTNDGSGFVLEQASSIGSPTLWQPIQQIPLEQNNQFSVTFDTSIGNRFFRLHGPPLTSIRESSPANGETGVAVIRELGLDEERVNVNGGAIALGHPLGMSGARLALTAVHGMEKRGGKLALATMCVGVGQGVAVAIEKLN
jgi:hypothetical protein